VKSINLSDSDITRLASAIVDELERRKEELRVEAAKERNADGCDGCARQLPEFWTGGVRFHRVSEDTWKVCSAPKVPVCISCDMRRGVHECWCEYR
jgi:hypothetical protein